jgi:hypothetical protein
MTTEIIKIDFEENSKSFLKLLAKMKMDLQEYALKETANKKTVEIKTEQINKMYLFYSAAKNAINALENENKTQFSNGFLAGEKKTKKQYPHRRETDKETARYNSILQLEQKMPHLF